MLLLANPAMVVNASYLSSRLALLLQEHPNIIQHISLDKPPLICTDILPDRMYRLFSISELHHYSSTDRLSIFPDRVGIHDLLTRAKTRWVGDEEIRPFNWPAHHYAHYESCVQCLLR